jgi:Tol biopolymer transport system component
MGLTIGSGLGAPAPTTRVSVASDGTEGNNASGGDLAVISADGRLVDFDSSATNLVAGDTNNVGDIFVHDRQTGVTERVSVASDGTEGNANSLTHALSADGRYVAFGSNASNLVAGDTNNTLDVFVRDRQTGATERVSVASNGAEANGISAFPALSADGRLVAFYSFASNLVPGDTNNTVDIFVRDRQAGTTTRVSVASNGIQGNNFSFSPALSADGRYVAFGSFASNLVPGDTNGSADVFVHDRQTGLTERVSVGVGGIQGNQGSLIQRSAISADGRLVAFASMASNLVPGDTNDAWDVFVRDRQAGTTERVSLACGGQASTGQEPALSADGRFVAFRSFAPLVPGDTNNREDIFVYDRQGGTTTRVSLADDGAQANGESRRAALSADARVVAFSSLASNLVPDDTNGVSDVFVRGFEPENSVCLWQKSTQPVTETLTGLSPDQHVVTFQNGTPGLRAVRVTVNGRVLPMVTGLRDGEVRRVDVARYLKPGATNTVIIRLETAWGGQPGSAIVSLGG